MSDRRFLAAFDAYRQGILSYGGLLENLYGDPDYKLFPDLNWYLTGFAFRQLAEAVERGDISIPDGLREEYPELYEHYAPELHGRRR